MGSGISSRYFGTHGSKTKTSFSDNINEVSKKYPLSDSGYFGEKGNGKGVRVIETNTPYKTARDFFDKIAKGQERKPLRKDKTQKTNQQYVEFADGTRVNKRIKTSSSGSPAIDIFITTNTASGVKTQKIHFAKNKQGGKSK